jgi:hypothetical protein
VSEGGGEVDFRVKARMMVRDKFAAAHAYPFLIGINVLERIPWGRMHTLDVPRDFGGALFAPLSPSGGTESNVMILAVRKVQEAFPSMITVGRSANNDVVIDDRQISKLHAFFKNDGDKLELFDAGSRNGTFVGSTQIKRKDPGATLTSGDRLRFGRLPFLFVDAATLWDQLQI